MRGTRAALFALLAIWLAMAIPLALGERTLALRDVLWTHLPYKWFGAQALAAGTIPAFDPDWALGQPFRGNPSALAFYPGNLLYLALPFWSAFGLHFMLHWLLAAIGMHRCARALGQGEDAALVAALTYAGSGFLVSTLTFYNLLAVAAWVPWAMAGLVRGGRRGIAWGGVALGMALLGGEPVSLALALPLLLLAAVHGRGLRRGTLGFLAALGLGLLVALPQIVATARVAGFSYRAAHGVEAGVAGAQALHPARLLELLVALPWGRPGELGRFGFWAPAVTPHVPYIYSLHVGVVALALALWSLRRQPRWAVAAGAGLFLAWAGGAAPSLLASLTAGLFRYPQKFLFVFTLAIAPLAGWGADRALADPRAARAVARAAGGVALAALALWFAFEPVSEALRRAVALGANEHLARAHTASWIAGLALGAAALALAAWALRRRSGGLLVAAQAVALAGLAPAVVTEPTTSFAAISPWSDVVAANPAPRAVVNLPSLEPRWEASPPPALGEAGFVGAARLGWESLEHPYGMLAGFSYPLAPDNEGLASPLSVFVARNLARAAWPVRVDWFRRLGVGWVVRSGAGLPDGLERRAAIERLGTPFTLERVVAPLPFARWPARVVAASGPVEAWSTLARAEDGDDVVVASRAVAHRPGARVELVAAAADRIEVDVDGEGGVLTLQRAFHPLWRARLESGARLPTLAVDVELLGVELPAGRHRVVVDVASWPEVAAGAVAAVTLFAALLFGARRESLEAAESAA